jgi:uncharacterized protein YlxW (UPF0749 family)
VLVGGVSALLGLALVVQVRTTNDEAALSGARPSDLVRILDDLGERSERLEREADRLERVKDELSSGADRESAARDELRSELDTLLVLSGSVPVTGPGIEVLIIDREGGVEAADLLDAVQELRDAGAEAIEVNGIRWIGSSSVVDGADGLVVDGDPIGSPYRIRVIADPETLATSLAIPGGVIESIRELGGDVSVTEHERLVIDSLKPLPTPEYAAPADE